MGHRDDSGVLEGGGWITLDDSGVLEGGGWITLDDSGVLEGGGWVTEMTVVCWREEGGSH